MGKQVQVVDGEGEYGASAVGEFLQRANFVDAGVDYVVVAIMGPQSSGKSTLLNLLARFRLYYWGLSAWESSPAFESSA